MKEFTDYWIKQSYEHRLAARFGYFPIDQPELPLEWEIVDQPLLPFNTVAGAAIALVLDDGPDSGASAV